MRATTLQLYKERMLRVLVYIQQHLDGEISLEELAGIACFSPYHFHRIFRGMMGESLGEHLRRLRLERAASQLKRTGRAVTAIALEAGYNSPQAFTRAFGAAWGVSPSRFRSRDGGEGGSPAPSGVHYQAGSSLNDFEAAALEGNAIEVRIETLEPTRVAFVRHVGPYDECGGAWDKLTAELGSRGLLGADTRFIGLCHDDPEVTPAAKVRYDACVTVDPGFQPGGGIGVQTIAGGDYAVTTHFGPYDQLGQTYARLLGEWLPRSGRELRSLPCLEVYLNDPEGTDPEDLITDIYSPLEEQ